jgi:hypothetical protein
MKHRLSRLAIVVIVFASIFTFASTPTPAHAACTILDNVGPFSINVYLVVGHSYTDSYYRVPSGEFWSSNTYTAVSVGPIGRIVPSGYRNVIVDNSCGDSTPPVTVPLPTLLPLFTDGRENNNDALQTAAVYCGVPNAGDVSVYALFDQKGYLAFTVTKEQLAAGNQKPDSPYLIKAGMGAELWRLQDGSLRIKRGTYVFDWPGC